MARLAEAALGLAVRSGAVHECGGCSDGLTGQRVAGRGRPFDDLHIGEILGGLSTLTNHEKTCTPSIPFPADAAAYPTDVAAAEERSIAPEISAPWREFPVNHLFAKMLTGKDTASA
jgi:hypothetical protein